MASTILTCVLLVCITLIALAVIAQVSENARLEKRNENLRLLLELKEAYLGELDIERDKDKEDKD